MGRWRFPICDGVVSKQVWLARQGLAQVNNIWCVKMPLLVKPVLREAQFSACDSGNARCYLVGHCVSLAVWPLRSICLMLNCCIGYVGRYISAWSLEYLVMNPVHWICINNFELCNIVCLSSLLWWQVPGVHCPLCEGLFWSLLNNTPPSFIENSLFEIIISSVCCISASSYL